MLLKQAEVQYFIGVQLDGSEHVEPLQNCIPEDTAKDSEKLVSSLIILMKLLENSQMLI
ncbi:hypothetical protein BHE74_00001392 [Ensete ventricosum]|uniref:Uncharacterized protein n=1 Tax=Ensete ventricosum TaxID=4639 RepID=A0A444GHC9_ENSVE|nr:hypothetical protein GW17_00000935 [Ensete ventricosum]RWW89613.1 hypothetical protein BHE74_00001392 [Ensete ventricosum]RZR71846.1 hypothetical protein BHM03_00007866 [Ensete ventricosum]